jgi:glycine/D-amino acid oxidase-like deaminating enzyme
LDYFSGVRLGSGDRRPLVGAHPHHSKIWLVNGLSTKGVSLMPWLAKETADALEGIKQLDPEIDIRRFKRTQLL